MAWIGSPSERFYFRPTTNRIPLSIFENYQRFALAEAATNFVPGFHAGTTDADVPTPWLTIAPKPVSLGITPTVEMRITDRAQARIARAAAKRRKGADGEG